MKAHLGYQGAGSRACLQSLNPEKDCSDGDHGEIVGGTLLVSCGDASKVLQPVDQALDDVALPVCLAVEVGLTPLLVGITGVKSWLWKSEHRDKWSFCLKAARMRAAQEKP